MEYWLTLGAAVLACLAVLAGRDRRPAGVVALGVLLVTAVGAMWLGERSGARDLVTTERAAAVPRQTTDGGYVSSDACRACHPGSTRPGTRRTIAP